MSNKRLHQLAFAYADLTDISLPEAKKVILRTSTGKAIADGKQSVLYEQYTANLYSIVSELGIATNNEITTEMIKVSVSKATQVSPDNMKYKFSAAKPAKKRMAKRKLLQLQKRQIDKMKITSKNLLTVGRALNAD